MADQISIPRALDANGDPISGAITEFYESGTTDPLEVFTDTGLSASAGSSITADSGGNWDQVFVGAGTAVKLVQKTPGGTQYNSLDPAIVVPTDASAASGVSFTPTSEISATNVQDAIEEVVSDLQLTTTLTNTATNQTVTAADRSNGYRFTSAATLSFAAAAALGSNFFFYVKADAQVTLDPNGSETIDGKTTLILPAGSEAVVGCDGTALYTLILKRPPFVQEFTSSGTYTPTRGAKRAYVEVQGAGGGGGGTGAAGAGSEGGAGGGGGAGGYAAKWIDLTALTGDPTITIGAAGTAGATGGGDGGDGGDASYDDTSVGGSDTLTARGGKGGTHASNVGVSQAAKGGDGGGASGGDVNAHGQPGGAGFVLDGAGGDDDVIGGHGGSSRFGGGGPTQHANNTGVAGQGYGAGGSGAAQQNTTNRAGGAGAPCYVRITEHF